MRPPSGSPLFARLSDCPYTAKVRALSGGLGGGEKRVKQKLEDAQFTKWRHKAMWLCDSATSRFFLVPGWALPGGCGLRPCLTGGWLGLALAGWGWHWLHTQHALTKLTVPWYLGALTTTDHRAPHDLQGPRRANLVAAGRSVMALTG